MPESVSPLNEIAQEVRSKQGHSVEAYKRRIRGYRKALRESTRAIDQWHKLATQKSKENAILREIMGMHPSYAFEDKEAHRKWREESAKRALEQLRPKREIVREPCRRLHLDVSAFAYLIAITVVGVAGYLLGRLHV